MSFFDGIRSLFTARKAEDIQNGENVVDVIDTSGVPEEQTADEFVAWVKSELERRRNDRQAFELQWLLNANFLAGHQYCEINPRSHEIEEIEPEYDFLERGVYNRIAPLYDTRMANLRNVRYLMTVKPATGDLDDLAKAEISTGLLRYTQRNVNWDSLKDRIYGWSELTGTAFVLSWWDANAGRLIGTVQEETGGTRDICEGDLVCGILSPYEVFPESVYKETVDEQRNIITDQVLDAGAIYDLYGLRVEGRTCDRYVVTPISGAGGYGLDTFSSTVMATKTERVDGCEHVITFYEPPTKKFPDGRMAIIIGEKLYYYGVLPYERVPIVAVKCKAVTGQFFGKSFIQELIPLQRAYNGCKNQLHDYIKSIVGEPILIPDGAVESEELDEMIMRGIAPNQIINYKNEFGTPSRLRHNGIPTEIVNEMNQLAQDMEYAAGISQLMVYGSTPSGITSGTAIESLRQIDNTRLSLTSENMRSAVKELAVKWLHIYKRYATGVRVCNAVGVNAVGGVLTWMADDINSYDVVFDTENELITSEETQKQNFITAMQMGLFSDENGTVPVEIREKLIEQMRINGYSQVMTQNREQIQNAQRENSFFESGVIPERYIYDDDAVHLNEHLKYALQYRFRMLRQKNPEYCKYFDQHIDEHRAAIAEKEQKAMARAMAMQSNNNTERRM